MLSPQTRRGARLDTEKRVIVHRQESAVRDGRAGAPERPRALFVVSRTHSERYYDLMYAFGADGAVEVILDRRCTERRQRRDEQPSIDRRQSDRRSWDTDAALRTLGWAVIRYPLRSRPQRQVTR